MKRIAFCLAIAAGTAALPAHANSGIGLLVMWIPAAILALLPAILIEAVVLARLLGERFSRAVSISAAANITSTVAGAAIAFALDIALFWSMGSSGAEYGRGPALVALVPMFFITWWIEARVVRRMEPDERKPRARRATFAANAATYALMAIGVALFVSPMGAMLTRNSVTGALFELSAARVEVEEHFRQHNAFPAAKAFPVRAVNVRSLALEPNGRLVLVLSYPGSEAGDGKRIVYEPVVASGKIEQWRCTSDLAPKYLPASCR